MTEHLKSNRISGGAPAHWPMCGTCPSMKHDAQYPGWGWCQHPNNIVPHQGRTVGFTPSQSPTGTCDLHPARAAQKDAGMRLGPNAMVSGRPEAKP